MKYVAYYRVSTKKQGDSGLGLSAQRAIIKHFYPEIHAEYQEVASGGNYNRPVLNEAMEFCIKNKHTLVVAKLDRLSRTTEDSLDIYSRLNKRLETCDIPSLDKFTLTLFMALADREKELVSIRTTGAMSVIKKDIQDKGVYITRSGKPIKRLGSPENLSDEHRMRGSMTVALNSKKNKNNRMARPFAQELRNNGNTYRSIAKRLNDAGYESPNGGVWYPSSIQRLLQ
jgi:DNA invertase Pin-like site-specific DNA recombinase